MGIFTTDASNLIFGLRQDHPLSHDYFSMVAIAMTRPAAVPDECTSPLSPCDEVW